MLDQHTAPNKTLQLFPVFQALPPLDWKSVVRESRYLSISGNSVLFESNLPCQGFPLLLSGSIRVMKMREDGRSLLLYRVEPGQICVLSISCLLSNTTYLASGIAESDLSMMVIPPALFNQLLEKYELFRTFVFRLFSKRLTELMQLVEEVAFLKLDQRLAALLLAKGIEIHATHQKLADELGSVREIISRLLRSFEVQGIVSLSRERIQVLDTTALRSIANGEVF